MQKEKKKKIRFFDFCAICGICVDIKSETDYAKGVLLINVQNCLINENTISVKGDHSYAVRLQDLQKSVY